MAFSWQVPQTPYDFHHELKSMAFEFFEDDFFYNYERLLFASRASRS